MSDLLLDAGVLIAIEIGDLSLDLFTDDDIAIAAVTAAELLEGVERATPQWKRSRSDFVEAVLRSYPVVDYTLKVARAHARLLAFARTTGVTRGVHDLIVAATALTADRTLVTTDAKADFGALPGVQARLVTS